MGAAALAKRLKEAHHRARDETRVVPEHVRRAAPVNCERACALHWLLLLLPLMCVCVCVRLGGCERVCVCVCEGVCLLRVCMTHASPASSLVEAAAHMSGPNIVKVLPVPVCP